MKDKPINQEQRERVRSNELRHADNISEITRFIGFGLSTLPWSLAFADQKTASLFFDSWRNWVWLCAACGILVLLLDYVQHKAGLVAATAASKHPENIYVLKSWPVWVNQKTEMLKETVSLIGCALLVVTFVGAFCAG